MGGLKSPERFMRYARTLRHLKPSQVAWRCRYAVTSRLPRRLRIPTVPGPAPPDPSTLSRLNGFMGRLAAWHPAGPEEVSALLRNAFSFLNHAVPPAPVVDWSPPGATRPWLYQLHGFDYLRTLGRAYCVKGDPSIGTAMFGWMCDWVQKNPPLLPPAWDAYVIACRLMNWAQAIAVTGAPPPNVWRSFALQTEVLLRRLEWDVLANHLLKDALALVVAGQVLGRETPLGQKASRRGLLMLERQLAEQVLPDGGHYERSFMYHAHVLEDCLAARESLQAPPRHLDEAIARMTAFLSALAHDDGTIPLFGDAAQEGGIAPRALVGLAGDVLAMEPPSRPRGSFAAEASGYYVLQETAGSGRLIAKAGQPGPAYQLGHAHCDLLSFEFSAGGHRIIVDSGVLNYEDDVWRAYCRSTAAHNTLRVAGREQMECWSRFRVGRRYQPTVHAWGPHAGGWRLRASHDGCHPWRHLRTFYLADDAGWVIVDRVDHGGPCRVESFIHFHPEAEVMPQGTHWTAERNGQTVRVVPFGFSSAHVLRGSTSPRQGWHCPSFGVALPAPCLVLEAEHACPVVCGYAIVTSLQPAKGEEDIRKIVRDRLQIDL